MSTEPAEKDRPTGDATGVYLPPTLAAASQLTPPTQGGTSGAPAADATGIFVPSDSSATIEERVPDSSAPAATGIYVPEAPAETPAASGVYLATETQTPGSRTPLSQERPEATGVYVPQATEARGGRVPTAEAGVGGATADFDLAENAAAEGTLVFGQSADSDFVVQAPRIEKEPKPRAARYDRYLLKRFHAKGGMGEIWLAEDPALGRSVALKRMLSKRPDHEHRFLVEAQVTGQLEHPGIVPVHDLGLAEDGQPFYVMKFVRGRTLHKVIEQYHAPGAPTVNREVERLRLLHIFISLCQTVAYAHSRGVLHRDLKPENVMLGTFGETLLLDWGIAKVMGQPEGPAPEAEAVFVRLHESGTDTGTQAGAIMGSPSYMAPEVAAGLHGEVDQRSDVYLLGATLYEILTDRLPRQGTTVFETIKIAQREPPVPPRKINPQVPRPLDAICRKAMAHRKEDRYQSALELAEDMQRYIAGEPVSAYREGLLARSWRWARRHRKVIGQSAAAVLVVGLLTFGYVQMREAERHAAASGLEAERLRSQEQARRDVKEFRRLADETRFYAATTDPVAEHAPYFDPRMGEVTGQAALAISASWGPGIEKQLLENEQAPLKKELYDLLLLMAQTKSQQASGRQAAEGLLALLMQAGTLREPSRSYYRLQADAHRLLGEDEKAAAELRHANDPQTPTTTLDHFLLGEQYRHETMRQASAQAEQKIWELNRAQLTKAINEYRQALRIDPDHFWSHFQLGRCYLNLKQGPEAVEALGACVALRPDSPWGYSIRGLALGLLDRYSEAEWNLGRAIALSPDFRPPRLNRGALYWQQWRENKEQEKLAAALADFDAVLQPPDDKRLIEAAFYRGQIFLELGEVDKALEDFNRVVAVRKTLRPVYTARAQIYFARGLDPLGLQDLNSYLSIDRSFDAQAPEAFEQRGRLLRFLTVAPLLRKKQVALALADLEQAVKLGVRSAALFDDLGAMLEHTGRIKEAVDAYTRGLQLAPVDPLLLIKRGWALEQLNQYDAAQADFTAALGVQPTNAEAHTGVGYLRARRKAPVEAQREADLALLNGHDKYLILHNVACIYATLSESDPNQRAAHQDATMALLRRAVELWKRERTGPNEIELIKGEPAFPPSLRQRPDYEELVGGSESKQ